MSEKIPYNPVGEMETRPGQNESIESFDRDLVKLRARITRLKEATATYPKQSSDILRYEAKEIFLLLQRLFTTLEHDQLRGNIGLSASGMSTIHEQISSNSQEQNQLLEKIDKVRNLLHVATECSRIADQIYELMMEIHEIEKKF